MEIAFEAKICHIGFTIGYFTKEYVISWADKIISILEVQDIPDDIFDLSMVKKPEDTSKLLINLSQCANEDKALKTIVGMIYQNYKNKQISLYETCEFLYRLSNFVDAYHYWNSYLYTITGNLETALDGFGDVDASLAEVEEFLAEHEKFSKCFDPGFVPNKPLLIEVQPKKEHVIIDVSRVLTPSDLHLILKTELDFPDFYGMNWNAFWDAITGMVKMPKILTFSEWSVLKQRFPEEAKMLEYLIQEYKAKYYNNFNVIFL